MVLDNLICQTPAPWIYVLISCFLDFSVYLLTFLCFYDTRIISVFILCIFTIFLKYALERFIIYIIEIFVT